MTDPVCVNSCTLTKKLFYEANGLVYRDKNGKLLNLLFAGLGVLWAVLTGVALWNGDGIVLALLELAVLVIAWLWANVVIPNGKAKRAWEKVLDPERTVSFYDNSLTVETGERSLTVKYGEIVRTLKGKNALVLITDSNSGIILARSGFTKGSETRALEIIKGAENDD
ncbi:MAG: YcxB family protein [Oscillospiraceae bacterium]|nr:YcxB family protein [Oscillospiraceae bacterium]